MFRDNLEKEILESLNKFGKMKIFLFSNMIFLLVLNCPHRKLIQKNSKQNPVVFRDTSKIAQG
ncbi:hypothetical protein LEP1GSC062_4175 [Leptospira alexanderi serovar Manhao 3 str. L 60]|uniref:Uncharacterized protein n=1 Tax=Leptospira alexanderi serovar Manhao 3 str. L 60 TaxID=1049759 RepID=V6HWS4_9LEPT|nr:hypothetical protein LEP1GSC062_4175 [Leptospira alexanderi serovar Manhao 3 str. L 60]